MQTMKHDLALIYHRVVNDKKYLVYSVLRCSPGLFLEENMENYRVKVAGVLFVDGPQLATAYMMHGPRLDMTYKMYLYNISNRQ